MSDRHGMRLPNCTLIGLEKGRKGGGWRSPTPRSSPWGFGDPTNGNPRIPRVNSYLVPVSTLPEVGRDSIFSSLPRGSPSLFFQVHRGADPGLLGDCPSPPRDTDALDSICGSQTRLDLRGAGSSRGTALSLLQNINSVHLMFGVY
jgi:hypothetical protein